MLSQVPQLPEAPEPASGGITIPYLWLAGAADAALVTGLIETGASPVQAGLIGTALLTVPWLIVRACQDRQR